MNKLLFSLIFIGAVLINCSTTPVSSGERSVSNSPQDFSQITGKEWKLTEVRVSGSNTGFNRTSVVNQGFSGDVFTLRFASDSISGVGAPNRYSAPYSTGQNGAINIGLIASTLMASIFEPENLKEHDFFTYLQNAYRWNLTGNNLQLNSRNANGAEVVLIFAQ